MPTLRAAWGTSQTLRKGLALLQDFHSFRTDTQRRPMVKRQKCWPNSTRPPQVPALLVGLGKFTFLLPTLSPTPLFVHPGCLDWKMFSCDCVHVFVLESPPVQSLGVVLGEYFCSLGKRKWKILFSTAFCQTLVSGKKESNVFSWPKKTRKCRFGVFCKSCQSLEFSGENTAEISETSIFIFPRK